MPGGRIFLEVADPPERFTRKGGMSNESDGDFDHAAGASFSGCIGCQHRQCDLYDYMDAFS